MSVTHSFVSVIPDGTDATLVKPSNWNAGHTVAISMVEIAATGTASSSTFLRGDATWSVIGNASTATALATGRTISITGDLAYTTPTFDGTANITALGTLATVNANIGTFNTLVVNGKGLVTSASNTSYQPLDATLTALAAYNTNGILTQTAADTFAGRTITGTSNRIDVSNGNGVSGNPTIDIAATYVGQASITTLGTVTSGVWNGTSIGVAYGGAGKSPLALFDHFVDANNTNTDETDLYSDTIAAGQLSANGDKLFADYGGVFSGAVSATQQLKIYFGGTAIFDSGALSIGVATPSWDIYVTIIRVSSSVVRCVVSITTASAALATTAQYTEVTGLTLSGTNILKITGTAGGVSGASSQITAKLGVVSYQAVA